MVPCATKSLLSSLVDVDLLTKDWKSDPITDQVCLTLEFNKLCMLVSISKIPHNPLLNQFLFINLVILDIDWSFLWNFRLSEECWW